MMPPMTERDQECTEATSARGAWICPGIAAKTSVVDFPQRDAVAGSANCKDERRCYRQDR